MCCMSPKDKARVERSIKSIYAKIEVSMALMDEKRNQRFFESEKELEEYCFKHGLIYSPTKYPYFNCKTKKLL